MNFEFYHQLTCVLDHMKRFESDVATSTFDRDMFNDHVTMLWMLRA